MARIYTGLQRDSHRQFATAYHNPTHQQHTNRNDDQTSPRPTHNAAKPNLPARKTTQRNHPSDRGPPRSLIARPERANTYRPVPTHSSCTRRRCAQHPIAMAARPCEMSPRGAQVRCWLSCCRTDVDAAEPVCGTTALDAAIMLERADAAAAWGWC